MKKYFEFFRKRKGLDLLRGKQIFLNMRSVNLAVFGIIISLLLISCEDFIEPDQELIKERSEMFTYWEEYRSAELGLYALQQNLVEQIVILGDLRSDILKVTANSSPELREIQNFNISRDNPYASPVNFYKLINASNSLIKQLQVAHPEVLDKNAPITNYDRLYGEALCMRAWTYFNAVMIYGKVPYIHESLNNVEEIEDYLNSSSTYVDSVYINFAPDGYENDTITDTTIVLEKHFLDQHAVIDTFTRQLEQDIKAVGVNHAINTDDLTWQASIWSNDARHVLLGKMYLFDGDLAMAMHHFNPIIYNYTSETDDIRYGLDDRFARSSWKNIFTGIDTYEHIFTLWFGKSYRQSHELQSIFSIVPPNDYLIKPTAYCIRQFESIWNNPRVRLNDDLPGQSETVYSGVPGDFFRGYGVSYKYYKDGEELHADTVQSMLVNKQIGKNLDVLLLMNDVDTVATKYSIGKDEFAQDANFIIYRAADVHLYAAEIFTVWDHIYGGLATPRPNTVKSIQILNSGGYANRDQLGVRGRVGFDDGYEAVKIPNIIYFHDPVTNEIIGHRDLTGKFEEKQKYLVDKILEERVRELAFEGKRFYDLMRIAKRRNDPSYLADKVAGKFSGPMRTSIREKLMNEKNWYINYYE